jgi:hypothetical protein
MTREESFLFSAIRKYNKAGRQTQRDVVLHSVGVQAKLIERKRSLLPELTSEEREQVLKYLRNFCQAQGIEIRLKENLQ